MPAGRVVQNALASIYPALKAFNGLDNTYPNYLEASTLSTPQGGIIVLRVRS